ncbi:MAG: PilZ domain-containing protein [Candidatus Sulfobium sp.]|jgi:PilZ domain
MVNTRKHQRFTLEGLDICARTLFNAEAEIINISATGASIRIARRLNIDGVYALKFSYRDNCFTVKGRVVWEKLTGSKESQEGEVIPIYTAGLEFQGELPDKLKQIGTFIEEKVTEIRERRLGGIRIRVTGDDSAVLSHLETCRVMDISLGGMSMESVHEVPTGTGFRLQFTIKENEPPLFCSGRVAFCRNGPAPANPEKYTVGVEFIEMSEGDREKLKRFVDSLSIYQ